jgi:hypothetical protein
MLDDALRPNRVALIPVCAPHGSGRLSHDGVRSLRNRTDLIEVLAAQYPVIRRLAGELQPEAGVLKSPIQTITQRAFGEGDADGYLNIGELNLDFGITEPAGVARQAEALAGVEGLHPENARSLWELAARAHRFGGRADESSRCLASAAECYVAMAASVWFKGMMAASSLMSAIKALRHLPGTKERRGNQK